jgi:hypothetical protein
VIADVARLPRLLRFVAPLAWRGRATIARRLMGFSHTEQGSALDMFRAAELTEDPRLRRLFYRHGLDEARHAQHFAQVAKSVGGSEANAGHYGRMHAIRQDLYERLGLVRFVAFVWLSESRAKAQFEALSEHFARHDTEGLGDTLHRLFVTIGRDEQFHASYSLQLLDEWRAEGRGAEVDRAIRSVRMDEAWMAWRRAGRRIGDVLVRVTLSALFLAVLPPFALIQRLVDRSKPTGWRPPHGAPLTLEDLKRPY